VGGGGEGEGRGVVLFGCEQVAKGARSDAGSRRTSISIKAK